MTPEQLRALPVGTVVRRASIDGGATARRVSAFRGRLDGDGWQVDGIDGPVSSERLHLYGTWEVVQP